MNSSENSLKNQLVLFESKGRIGIVTLNRPEKMNALHVPLIKEFKEVLEFINQDHEISVVILTGAGRAFSAGADIAMLHGYDSPAAFRRELKDLWHSGFDALGKMEKLFIAALNGITLGGGLELALACDLRVAAENISLALPEIKYGMIPDAGGTNRLAKLVGPAAAKEMALSGDLITSEEACRIGIVNKVLPSENFMHEVEQYASRFSGNSKAAVGLGKIAIDKSLSQDVKSGLEDAMFIQSILLKSEEYLDVIKKFKEKKK